MRVLGTTEFVKKIRRVNDENADSRTVIEILPNWQLKMSIPQDDGTLGSWLGPRIDEMDEDDYILFLSKVDEHAGSSLAQSYIQDQNQR
jgi:hypothetical protein